MKRTLLLLTLALAMTIPMLARTVKTETINLPTLQCGSCKKTIEKKMTGVNGIDSINVDVETKTATVTFDADVITLPQIEEKISLVGYDANETKADRKAQNKLHACCRPGAHD